MDTAKLLVELLDGDDGTVLWTGAGADLCNDNYGNEEVAEAVAAIAAGTATEVKVGGGAGGAFTIRKVDRTLYATVVRFWTGQVLRGAEPADFEAEAEATAAFRNRWVDAKTGLDVHIL